MPYTGRQPGSQNRPRLSPPEEDILRWQPVSDWVEVRPGAWQPPDYVPTDWELPSPTIETPEAALLEYQKCAGSAAYFILKHCWSLDVDSPDGDARWRKFPAYGYLREFFREVQDPGNTHVEKSRQMTFTWSWAALFLWDINFHDQWADLAISMLDTLVDDGGQASTANSFMGKVRVMHERLPPYLWHPYAIRKGMIRNIDRDSYIRGQAGTVRAGRGTTFRRALMDEASRISHGESVYQSMKQVAKNGLCLNATPNGKGDVFWRIRFNPHSTFKKLSYHWTRHPRYAEGLYCGPRPGSEGGCGWRAPEGAPPDVAMAAFTAHDCPAVGGKHPRSPWYDQQVRDMTPEQVAAELDISYEHSRSGRVFFTFDTALHMVDHTEFVDPRTGQPVGEIGRTETIDAYRVRVLRSMLVPHQPPVVAWDFGVGDPAWMILGQIVDDDEQRVRWLDAFWSTDKSYDFYARIVRNVWEPIWREVGGPAFYDFAHYGDPSGKNRDSSLMSWIQNLAQDPWGITVQHIPQKDAGPKLSWLDHIREQIRKGTVEVSTFVPELADAFQQYHFPVDEQGRMIPGQHEPVHDEWSHPMDAVRYLYQVRWRHRLAQREPGTVPVQEVYRMGSRGGAYDRREF
jgi:hypothetical protein